MKNHNGKTIFHLQLEFTKHQRTQQENRKKPPVDVDVDANTDLEENIDEIVDEDSTTTVKSITKNTNTKNSKSKSKDREGMRISNKYS